MTAKPFTPTELTLRIRWRREEYDVTITYDHTACSDETPRIFTATGYLGGESVDMTADFEANLDGLRDRVIVALADWFADR